MYKIHTLLYKLDIGYSCQISDVKKCKQLGDNHRD